VVETVVDAVETVVVAVGIAAVAVETVVDVAVLGAEIAAVKTKRRCTHV